MLTQSFAQRPGVAKDSRIRMNRLTKVCCDCRDEKPLDAFHNCADSPDGKQYRCIPCRKAYDRNRHREKRSGLASAFRRWIGMTTEVSTVTGLE